MFDYAWNGLKRAVVDQLSGGCGLRFVFRRRRRERFSQSRIDLVHLHKDLWVVKEKYRQQPKQKHRDKRRPKDHIDPKPMQLVISRQSKYESCLLYTSPS